MNEDSLEISSHRNIIRRNMMIVIFIVFPLTIMPFFFGIELFRSDFSKENESFIIFSILLIIYLLFIALKCWETINRRDLTISKDSVTLSNRTWLFLSSINQEVILYKDIVNIRYKMAGSGPDDDSTYINLHRRDTKKEYSGKVYIPLYIESLSLLGEDYRELIKLSALEYKDGFTALRKAMMTICCFRGIHISSFEKYRNKPNPNIEVRAC